MSWYKKAKKWKERIPGGRAEGKDPSDFNQDQIQKGKIVEKEHTPSKEVATEISMDHLEEFPNYYTGLDEMEKKLKKQKEKKKDDKCLHSLDIHCDGKDDGY